MEIKKEKFKHLIGELKEIILLNISELSVKKSVEILCLDILEDDILRKTKKLLKH